jgi:type I restriction enzyme S subunit
MSKANDSKPGYKHTPLGWIPDEWEVDFLDKLAKRGSGHTPDKTFNEYYNGGIKWISLADSFRLDKRLITETEIEISNKGIDNSSAVIHPKGTVVLSRDAGVGKSAVMGCDMAVSQHFITWSCNGKYHNWFLYYWLQLKKEYFERQAVGSTIKTIGLPFFKKLKIVNPPLPEQNKIGDILSIWDEAITKTQQLIIQLHQRKKGLMQQLLKPKEGWKEKKLSDIFERVVRKNFKGSTNVVTISAQRGFVKQNDFFKKIVASETLDNYFLVLKGEFCYNKSYSNGYDWGATKRLNNFDEAVVTTLYICFKINNEKKYSGDFFEFFFDACILNHGLSKIAHEGGRAHGLLNVTPVDFFNLRIHVPDYEEQIRIVQILSAAKSELKLYEQKLVALQQQKKGLMQKLLTGEVRVKV